MLSAVANEQAVNNNNVLNETTKIIIKIRPLALFFYSHGAGSRTRTYEARRREIYSLLSLPLDDSSTNIIITKLPKKAIN